MVSHTPETRPLTGKQQVLADNWLVNGFNGMKAAMAAGYCMNAVERELSCTAQASQTLTLPNVKAYIAKKQAEMALKAGWDIDWWREQTETALDDAQTSRSPMAQARVLEMVGKHIGAFEKDNEQKQDLSFKEIIAAMASKRAKQVESRDVPLLEQDKTPED